MKVTAIVGAAIAFVGLAACGSTAAPTERPATPTPTVAATPTLTPTATPIPTQSPSESPSPSASTSPSPGASPSPTEGPCGFQPCATGAGYVTTCAVTGTAQGGSLLITWTAGYGQTEAVVPDYITVDGHVVDVTSNPFTSGPYSAGDHSFTIPTESGLIDGTFPFTVLACGVVTVTTTCSSTAIPTGSATFSGLTVGDGITVDESAHPTLVESSTMTVNEIPKGSSSYVELNDGGYGVITIASGTFTIAACSGVAAAVTTMRA
jgi:hypothetical protein